MTHVSKPPSPGNKYLPRTPTNYEVELKPQPPVPGSSKPPAVPEKTLPRMTSVPILPSELQRTREDAPRKQSTLPPLTNLDQSALPPPPLPKPEKNPAQKPELRINTRASFLNDNGKDSRPSSMFDDKPLPDLPGSAKPVNKPVDNETRNAVAGSSKFTESPTSYTTGPDNFSNSTRPLTEPSQKSLGKKASSGVFTHSPIAGSPLGKHVINASDSDIQKSPTSSTRQSNESKRKTSMSAESDISSGIFSNKDASALQQPKVRELSSRLEKRFKISTELWKKQELSQPLGMEKFSKMDWKDLKTERERIKTAIKYEGFKDWKQLEEANKGLKAGARIAAEGLRYSNNELIHLKEMRDITRPPSKADKLLSKMNEKVSKVGNTITNVTTKIKTSDRTAEQPAPQPTDERKPKFFKDWFN